MRLGSREGARAQVQALRRVGYRLIHALICRDSGAVNHKRVQRICREEGFQMARRKRQCGVAAERRALGVPLARPEVWSLEFVSDSRVIVGTVPNRRLSR